LLISSKDRFRVNSFVPYVSTNPRSLILSCISVYLFHKITTIKI
jgi:hypothetical protein